MPKLGDNLVLLLKDGKFGYETRPAPPACTGREVIVRIRTTGICGSDVSQHLLQTRFILTQSKVHYWKHGRIGNCIVEGSIVLGHESAGEVVALGPNVTRLAVGDRVAIEPGESCNACDQCRRGKYNLCDSMKFAATPPYDGTLATFYKVPEECCFAVPPSLSFEEAALVEPMAVAVHCCKLAKVSPGKSLVIFGAGAIGLLCGAVAKAFGATDVRLVDIFQDRIDFAKEHMHLDAQISPAEGDESRLGAPDVVIEASGSQVCVQRAVAILARGGTMVQVGLGMNIIPFPMGDLCAKEGTLLGSFRYGPGDYAAAVDLLAAGRVNVKPLISKTYAFEEAEVAFQDSFDKKGIKQIIYGPGWQGE